MKYLFKFLLILNVISPLIVIFSIFNCDQVLLAKHFIKTNKINGRVNKLLTNSKNNVYVATYQGEIYKKNNETNNFELIKDVKLPIDNFIVDSKDNIYCLANQTKKIFAIDSQRNKFVFFNRIGHISLAVDASDNIYTDSKNGQIYKEINKNSTFTIEGIKEQILSLVVDAKGFIYAISNSFDFYYSDGRCDFIYVKKIKKWTYNLIIDANDNVYLTAIENKKNKLFKFDGESDFIDINFSLPEKISCLTADNYGNVYVGTRAGKIYQINGTADIVDVSIEGINEPIFNLAINKNNTIYASTGNTIYWKTNLEQ